MVFLPVCVASGITGIRTPFLLQQLKTIKNNTAPQHNIAPQPFT